MGERSRCRAAVLRAGYGPLTGAKEEQGDMEDRIGAKNIDIWELKIKDGERAL